MPIKPIDMQIMMPRVSEASRIQNDEQQHNHAALQDKALASNKQAENSTNQVNSREDDEKTIIKDKRQKNKGQSSEKDSREQQEENKEKHNNELNISASGRTIDIRL